MRKWDFILQTNCPQKGFFGETMTEQEYFEKCDTICKHCGLTRKLCDGRNILDRMYYNKIRTISITERHCPLAWYLADRTR